MKPTVRRLRPFERFDASQPHVEEVRQLAIRGAGQTILSMGGRFLLQIVATAVLARLLTPTDFGVVTMVTTFSLLVTNFGLNGFTEAIIQRESVDHRLVSNVFWINFASGLLLTVGFAMSGSLLAAFYHEPRLGRIAVGMSTTILITCLSVEHLALLKRAMRFGVLSANDVFARAVSVVVSVVMAWAGWGYWALVAGAIFQSISVSVGAWAFCSWIPSLPTRRAGTRSVLTFALNVYGRFSINYCSRNMDNLLVGWRFDAVALGFYKKAYDLFTLTELISPFTTVAVSALSRLSGDSVKYQRYLLRVVEVVSFSGLGVAAILTLAGKDVIRVVLGPNWEPAGRIFAFFGPGIGGMLLYLVSAWVHLSLGRADRWFRWSIVELLVTISLFVLGLHWGPSGVAMAWTLSFWILIAPAFVYAGRPINLGFAPVLAAMWKYIVASLFAGCATATVIEFIPAIRDAAGASGALLRLATIAMTVGLLYIGATVALHQGGEPIYRVAELAREMIVGRRGQIESQQESMSQA